MAPSAPLRLSVFVDRLRAAAPPAAAPLPRRAGAPLPPPISSHLCRHPPRPLRKAPPSGTPTRHPPCHPPTVGRRAHHPPATGRGARHWQGRLPRRCHVRAGSRPSHPPGVCRRGRGRHARPAIRVHPARPRVAGAPTATGGGPRRWGGFCAGGRRAAGTARAGRAAWVGGGRVWRWRRGGGRHPQRAWKTGAGGRWRRWSQRRRWLAAGAVCGGHPPGRATASWRLPAGGTRHPVPPWRGGRWTATADRRVPLRGGLGVVGVGATLARRPVHDDHFLPALWAV